MSNTTNTTEISSYLTTGLQTIAHMLTIPTAFLSLILFPFYVYVNRVNRARDERTAIFAFTNHFYYAVKCTCTMIFIALPVGVIIGYYIYNRQLVAVLIVIILAVLIYFIFNVITQVQHVLITLLALQRFLLYYAPSFKPFINVSQRTMKVIISLLYVLFFTKDVLVVVGNLWAHKIRDDLKMGRLLLGQAIFYAALNGLLVLSASLYIPLTISIRKFAHLASSIESQPQKYVFYQTVSLVIGKTIFLPAYAVMFLCTDCEDDSSSPLRVFLLYATLIDVFSMPLMIEIAYLSCNKRNIDVLLSYPIRDALKMTLCGGEVPIPRNRVADVSVNSTTHNQA